MAYSDPLKQTLAEALDAAVRPLDLPTGTEAQITNDTFGNLDLVKGSGGFN